MVGVVCEKGVELGLCSVECALGDAGRDFLCYFTGAHKRGAGGDGEDAGVSWVRE